MTNRAAERENLSHGLTSLEAWLDGRLGGQPYKAAPSPRRWDTLEAAFYAALAKLLSEQSGSLADLVQSSGVGAVNNFEWWSLHEAALADEFSHNLGALARLGAQAGREAVNPSFGINWGLVNRSAVDWAGQHAGELVRNIDATTRAGVQQAVSEWAESGQPLSALADRIRGLSDSGVFSPQRARVIAQTESTNAYARGNVLAWQATGMQPVVYAPAAHVGCRCYLQPYRLPTGEMVAVWYTAHDERVCTQPLETPWGTVAGCRALHDTIVSSGPWLGTKKP